MSRAIKFRVWDKEMKVMILDDKRRILKYEPKDTETDFVVFMQYTGIKDKNGVEIYEGDIVKIAAFPNDQITHAQIKYYPNCMWFGFEFASEEHLNILDINLAKGIEIVGSIYSNPTLMEG